MKCRLESCSENALSFSEFCWGHLSEKDAYRQKLLAEVRNQKNLSGHNFKKANLSQMDLSGLSLFDSDFSNADLIGVNFSDCDLAHCDFRNADLAKATFKNSRLWNAALTEANLTECDLSGADLWNANLFNVKLWHAALSGARALSKRNFDKRDTLAGKCHINESGYAASWESYRDLKQYFISNGMYDDASWASFKEKTMERLILKKKGDLNYLPSLLMNMLCGYGEKPSRVVATSLGSITLFALIYYSLGAVELAGGYSYVPRWYDYLYYSTVTFTTVGFGDFIPKASALFRLLSASEAFLGVFFTGLFIFTLARKYSAR